MRGEPRWRWRRKSASVRPRSAGWKKGPLNRLRKTFRKWSGIPGRAKQGARQQEPCALFCGREICAGCARRGLPPSVKTYTRGKGGNPCGAWGICGERKLSISATGLGWALSRTWKSTRSTAHRVAGGAGPTRLFGLFGREEDYIISWDEIETLGEDIVLVSVAMPDRRAQGARGTPRPQAAFFLLKRFCKAAFGGAAAGKGI